jgi:Predicted metal-binding integral membrane protein (DUF2182)
VFDIERGFHGSTKLDGLPPPSFAGRVNAAAKAYKSSTGGRRPSSAEPCSTSCRVRTPSLEQLERSGAMSAMMMLRSPWAAGALLVAAGLYQLTQLKESCISHCRWGLLRSSRRTGGLALQEAGAFVHGAYCVGCAPP